MSRRYVDTGFVTKIHLNCLLFIFIDDGLISLLKAVGTVFVIKVDVNVLPFLHWKELKKSNIIR